MVVSVIPVPLFAAADVEMARCRGVEPEDGRFASGGVGEGEEGGEGLGRERGGWGGAAARLGC